MKKTKILVLSILATFVAATSVYAKLPGNTVVIEDKINENNAYDVNYLFDSSNIDKVNEKLGSTGLGGIFFINNKQEIQDIFQPTIIKKESDLNHKAIMYTSNSYPKGVTYTYNKDNAEYYFYDKPVIKFNITVASFNNEYFVVISYNNGFVNASDDSNGKLENNPSKVKINGLAPFDISSKDKTVRCFTNSKSIPISVLNDKDEAIAVGQIDLSNVKLGQATDVTYTLFKPLTNTTLDTPSGNSQNSGEVVVDGSDIYYSNSSDRGTLYKCNLDGKGNKELSEDKVKYLCVKGNYIYYSNLSDNGKLYAVNKNDIKDKKKVCDCVVNYLAVSSNLANNLLYFVNGSDSNKIYSFDTANINATATKVVDNPAKILNVIDNDIYYTNTNDSNNLYKYSGTTSSKISDVPDNLVQSIGKNSNELILCTSAGDVYKGSTKITINLYNSYTHTSIPDKASKINVIGEYIYYKSINDGGKLYRVSINGGNAEQVVPYAVDNIYAINSQILYYSQGGRLGRIDTSMDNAGKTSFTVTQPEKEIQKKILKVTDPSSLSGQSNPLPSTLKVTFTDSTVEDVPVYWNLNRPIYNAAETIYSGVLLGGMAVQYHYSEPSADFTADAVTSTIINNQGNKDTLIISGGGLQSGDTVKVYSVENNGTVLGQGVVGTGGKVFVNNLNIVAGTNLYISRTEKGKTECTKRKQIRNNSSNQIFSSPIITSITDNDTTYNGADGRDISIKIYNNSVKDFSKKYVYIVPKGTILDLNSVSSLKDYDLSDTSLWTTSSDPNYNSYTGTTAITTDSLGRNLNTGIYDVYLVGETTSGDKYSSDVRNVNLLSEQPVANVTPMITGDKFKAKGALSDVSVKLVGKTASGQIVNDIAKNYTVSIKRNGLSESDYEIDAKSNNAISLKKDYVNTLPVGDNEFQVILTDAAGKTISSNFIVTVNPASSFKISTNISKFTKGYAPSDVSIGITGVDKNGNPVTTSTTLNNLTVSVNNTPITNFTIDYNTVKLKSDFLSTLPTGDALVKIENEDLGLSETVALTVVDSQAELTPEINNFQGFAVGQAKYDVSVKLNAKGLAGENTTFSKIDSIEYEGTKIEPNLYSFDPAEGTTLQLKTTFLNELHSGDNLIKITGITTPSASSTEGSKISGTLNINVDSAKRLELKLKDSGKDTFTKASSQDLHYDVINYDNNNIVLDKSKVDLTKIKISKASYILQKDVDYDVDNINKVVTLRKSYLDKLICGDTTINVNLDGSLEDILLKVNDGTLSAKSDLTSFVNGDANADMNISVTGISVNTPSSDVIVKIKTNVGTITVIDPNNYIVTSQKITIKKEYLNTLSAAVAPYTIIISNAAESQSVSVTLNVTSRAQFTPISYTVNSVTTLFADQNNNDIGFDQNRAIDTTIKIGEKDCDGKDLPTANLTSIIPKVNNQTLTLTSSDYSISGDVIKIKGEFLNKLPKGTTTLTITKDGIVTPAEVDFVVK